MIKETDFQWTEEPLPELQDGQVLIRNLYLSLDPANRGWVREEGSYMAPIPLGSVMLGGTAGVVEESRNPNFQAGDNVQGFLGWQEYAVSDGAGLNKLPNNPAIPLTAYLGLFGAIGLTAYFGLLDIRSRAKRWSYRPRPARSARSSARSARSKAVASSALPEATRNANGSWTNWASTPRSITGPRTSARR
jgi:NADPH:quinone reductase-like Zn-dependent oxidoreductase